MSLRVEKINELIKNHLGEILSRELDMKSGVFITISKVDTSPDLRYTRVFVSIFPEKETGYAKKALQNEIYRIQGNLNKKLHMKPIPRISFLIDSTEVEAQKVEDILKEL